MDPSQDRQADQPAVVAPGSQSNGKIDLSTSAGEDRSQPAQRLVVRLDLRKIHTPRKGDTKGEKKAVYSKPAPSARTLRQRPEPPVHQVTQAKSNSSASISTRSSQTTEVSRSNGNSAGTGSDSSVGDGHPPKPNRPGLFKQLLDNMDRMNPKAFALPQDIRTYFRGVVTNSDGEYSDAIDYKPTSKRHSSNTGTSLSVEEDPLHLRDANGHYKACFRCNKTALGRQMIRCDHCPLYWHLDCLSPPLAHPPPSTRKWMCPNHADHVIPKRRKKRNPIPVTLSTPLARNDGDIEVLSDGSDFDERLILLDDGRQVSSRNVIYRVPEHGIKLGFVQKCRQIRQQQQQQQEKMKSQIGAGSFGVEEDAMSTDDGEMDDKADDHDTNINFRRLIAVAALEMREPGASDLLSALVSPNMSSSSSSSTSSANATHAILVQDAVLQKLDSKEEQDEYLQFRAFQRMVREQGAKNLVRRLVKEHEAQKAEAAMEGLLKMGESSSS
ncbi:hypothetical protein BGW41_002819 [Actinomortierella wolfii]|nr:hypothetical protein BGW41_002819 [Actinomortierella wolfii]